jgi:predicted DNA-binding ribbon-helix-helix protein
MPVQTRPQLSASVVVKRSVNISGRNSSVALEDAFWGALAEIAKAKGTTRPDLISTIDQTRSNANLSSAIRVFVLAYYQGLGR